MKYIKIILTIIAILLALDIVKSMIPSATVTSVQDVNISSVYGLRLSPLRVEIKLGTRFITSKGKETEPYLYSGEPGALALT